MTRIRFSRTNGEIDAMIDAVIQQAAPVCCPDVVREMIIAA